MPTLTSGRPLTLSCNEETFYYLTNIMGDVVGFTDANGNLLMTIVYEAYGTPYYFAVDTEKATLLSQLNPLYYRGYVTDKETGLYYLQSRYYDMTFGRFISSDRFVSTGQGLIGYNSYTYCLNNPTLFLDSNGQSASLPPRIANGLNLPASGGEAVVIDGTTYYYAIDIQNGEVYEYWFDSDGNLVWGRHHSDHNKPWKHSNPHDHKGGKDDDGNNTLVGGPQPVNEKFHGPRQTLYNREQPQVVGYVFAGAVAGYSAYQITKWVIATLLAPATGGSSYAFAALTP